MLHDLNFTGKLVFDLYMQVCVAQRSKAEIIKSGLPTMLVIVGPTG